MAAFWPGLELNSTQLLPKKKKGKNIRNILANFFLCCILSFGLKPSLNAAISSRPLRLNHTSRSGRLICFYMYFAFAIQHSTSLDNTFVRNSSGPFQVSQVQLTLLLHAPPRSQLKTYVFFPVVGSTIRRCTKLFALSRLHWALERTAHTGWHARFGFSHPPCRQPTVPSPLGSLLTSRYYSPLLFPSIALLGP